jgi:regulator of nonsense transcripts 1
MADAFTHLGNHLVSDSANTIRAGPSDETSTIDPDEALLFSAYGGRGPRGARRRTDDDDNETEAFDDDDESLASVPVNGLKNLKLPEPEEEKELPAHACA